MEFKRTGAHEFTVSAKHSSTLTATLAFARVTGTTGGRSSDGQIYALNDIAFNPAYGTFATAGGDGTFVFWDKDNRAKLKTFQSCKYPITAVQFNTPGDLFAYAVGYDWSKGHEFNNAQYDFSIQ